MPRRDQRLRSAESTHITVSYRELVHDEFEEVREVGFAAPGQFGRLQFGNLPARVNMWIEQSLGRFAIEEPVIAAKFYP
jgi:hypothetical protein